MANSNGTDDNDTIPETPRAKITIGERLATLETQRKYDLQNVREDLFVLMRFAKAHDKTLVKLRDRTEVVLWLVAISLLLTGVNIGVTLRLLLK